MLFIVRRKASLTSLIQQRLNWRSINIFKIAERQRRNLVFLPAAQLLFCGRFIHDFVSVTQDIGNQGH
jgi:hypothetical protein